MRKILYEEYVLVKVMIRSITSVQEKRKFNKYGYYFITSDANFEIEIVFLNTHEGRVRF